MLRIKPKVNCNAHIAVKSAISAFLVFSRSSFSLANSVQQCIKLKKKREIINLRNKMLCSYQLTVYELFPFDLSFLQVHY